MCHQAFPAALPVLRSSLDQRFIEGQDVSVSLSSPLPKAGARCSQSEAPGAQSRSVCPGSAVAAADAPVP